MANYSGRGSLPVLKVAPGFNLEKTAAAAVD
jgi:hypothetical protein